MGTTGSSITSWIGWSSRKLVTWLGLTRSLSWCHFPSYRVWEEAQVIISSIPKGYISIKTHSESALICESETYLCSAFESWTKLDVKSIVNVSNLQLKLPVPLAVSCVSAFDLINSAWSLNAPQMVSDQEGIKTRTPFLYPSKSILWTSSNLTEGRKRNRAAIVSLGQSHRRPFQMTNHRLLPRATSNQIKHVKTQTEHNYNALLQSIGVY